MTERTAEDVLRKTRDTLATAKQGLGDLVGDEPTRRLTGLRNVAVFGRSVTFVLQTMRSVDAEKFDAWYVPIQTTMKRDPLLKYFHDLRSEILKEGTPDHSSSIYIGEFGPAQMRELEESKPPGATTFFVGDALGGSGWKVPLSDGTLETYYVNLPESAQARFSIHLPNAPAEFLGNPIYDTSVQNLAALYVGYLEQLLRQAEAHFS